MRAVTFTKILLAFFAFFLISNTTIAQCDWEPVGLDDDLFFIADSSSLYKPDIVADDAGVVYTAFSDAQNFARATVKRYVNGYWSLLGNAGFSDARADYVKIAVDNLNHVYVAYQDYANGKKITVKYYNGFSWTTIGTPGFSPLKVTELDLTIDHATNKPFVTFADTLANITVMDFNGSSWNAVGTSTMLLGGNASLGMVANANTPYVVYMDTQNKMRVMTYNGIAWDSLGSTGALTAYIPSIALDNNNVVHVAFQGTGSLACVMYFNGSAWDYLGAPGISTFTAFYPALAFDAANTPYLAYWIFNQPQKGELAKFSGGTWSVLGQMFVPGTVSIPSQYARFDGIAINSATQEPFILYTQNNATPLLGMKDFGVVRHTGTAFKNTNGVSITVSVDFNTGGYSATFNYDPNGVPYVVYTDSANGDKVSVKKFNGTAWVQVGNAGFSTFDAEFGSIDFDAAGTPYVAFREQTSSPSVMKFDGTNWVYVGAPMFYPTGVGAYTNLAVNPFTNEPYIFFNDASLSYKGHCMRFNGSSWVDVGLAGFSAGLVSKCKIKFNTAGTPYVSYSDYSLGNKVIMKKYDGANWVTLGSGPVSTGTTLNSGFAIDASNNVYLTYADGGQSYQIFCQKFDGTSWTQLGGSLSNVYTRDCDVGVDAAGNVFVYYTDQYLNYWPGTVKRWFNNTWVVVGRQHISNNIAVTNTIRTNPATGLVTIGSVMQGFWNEAIGYYLKTLPCNFNTAIAGVAFADADSDCNITGGEAMLPNIPIMLTQGSNITMTFTDYSGNYYFTAMPAGTYTIGTGTLQSGYNVQCVNSQPHNTIVTTNNLNIENFALECTPDFDFIASSIQPIGSWWPGQYVMMYSHGLVQRTVCAGPTSPGTVTLVFPACLNYVQDTTILLQPTTVIDDPAGDTLIYNVADVYNLPSAFLNSMLTRAQICTTATANDTLCIQLIVDATGDNDPTNNTYTRCIGVTSSFDPNNKEVNPKGMGASGIIPDSTLGMVYTINFQNTGNAPAVNIVVKDTLSTNLEWESFQIVGSSHPMFGTTVTNGIVSFNFPNIMLPDSTSDEVNSHGFVTYKINLKPNLLPLTQIKNKAYIFFDYNEAVITNTAINTIENPLGIKEHNASNLTMYPNPTTGLVYLSRTVKYAAVYDMRGNLINTLTNANQIPAHLYADGIYFIRVIEANGAITNFKLLKLQ